MKKITEKSKHWKSVIMHLKRHHKKYLFGIFWWFALIKTALVFLWLSPVLNIWNTFANEEWNLVRLTEPFYTRAYSDYVEIHWLNWSNGGYKFNDSNSTGSVDWSGGYISNDGSSSVTINLTDQSHNWDYICAFAQTGAYSQTICSQYPIRIDATEPSVSTIFPVNWQDISDSNSIELSWSWSDDQSGLSGFLLYVSSPSWVSNYSLSSGQFIQNINLDSTWNRTRSVIAYDNVWRTKQASSYFVVNNLSNPDPDPNPNPDPDPDPDPDPNPQPEPSNPWILVLFRSEPFYTRTAHDYVQIEWTGWGFGGYKFSSTNDTGSVSSFDYITVNWNFVEVDLPDQFHNWEYICAFAWTDNESQTICTQYPIQVDATKPTISTKFPTSWQSFLKGESIEISWSWFDNQSGLSGFLLSVSSPSWVSNYNLSSGQFTKNINLGSVWNRSRSVTAYDNVWHTWQASSYFVVNNPSNPDPNTGNNSDPNQNVTGNSFFLIRPALFEEIELWNNITFRWNAWNINDGYTWSVKKIWWVVISSDSTTWVSTTLNNWLFSVWSYSRSVKDIHANTEKEIPLFYVIDSENIPDLKVTSFEFNEIDDADIDEYYKSNRILIDWLDDGWYTFAYLKDDIWALFINWEFVWTQWLVTNWDNIRVELKASNSYNETVSTKLVIGTGNYLVSDVFKVTTKWGITWWDNSSLTPMQKLWWAMFVDSLVEMYQYDERKLATFLSTFMQILKDKSDYYAQEILNAQEDWDEELLDEYKLYKNAVDFLYTIVKYRYENIEVEDRTVYIAPNGKQYLVEYNEERRAYTSPDFTKPKYFPTWESFKNHIDLNNPEVWKRWIVWNVITTHNGKVYTIYETNWKWTSSNFITKKYFDTKEDIINHILASNPASDWDHTVDTNFSEITYIAPSGKSYVIFKTSSKWNNPNMYSSYDFVNAKYFTSLEAIKKFIDQNNPKK